jgi:hypothetical protein
LASAFLIFRSVVEKHYKQAHLERPQRQRKKLFHVPGETRDQEGLMENFRCTAANLSCPFAQAGEWMSRFSGISKDDSEKPAVVLSEVELGLHSDVEAFFKIVRFRECLFAQTFLFGLNSFVVRLNDRFLTGKVVVSSAFRNLGAVGDFLHGGSVETILAEQFQCSRQDQFACLFAFTRGRIIFDHGQIMGRKPGPVKKKLNMVKSKLIALLVGDQTRMRGRENC